MHKYEKEWWLPIRDEQNAGIVDLEQETKNYD